MQLKQEQKTIETIWNKSTSFNERLLTQTFDDKWDDITLKQFNRWKKMIESDEEIKLEEFLSAYQMNEEILKDALASKRVELRDFKSHEDWIKIIQQVKEQLYEELKINNTSDVLFFNFVKPFLKIAKGQLEEKLRLYSRTTSQQIGESFNPSIIEELLNNLAHSLSSISSRTLILELNIARVSGQLKGQTSQERASYYHEVMLNDKLYQNSIREEYVVLTRMLATKTKYWIQNTYEILLRSYEDKPLLESNFNNGNVLGPIIKIDTGSELSDAHNEGKTVAILTFESGIKVVYKPRSLEVDEKFNDFISHLNNANLKYSLKTIITLNRDKYGWTEFISYKGCEEDEQVNRFYWRIGSNLAILYALNAVDFHHQNLIANGEFPILIDLESLFHNTSRHTDSNAISNAQDRIERSVLRIGLLPRKVGSKQGIEGIDLSALGAQEGQVSPHKTTVIVDRDKDTIRIEEKNYPIPMSQHRPLLNGEIVNVVNYEEDIIKGFEATYAYFMNNKEAMVEKLDDFQDVLVRQIVRGTARYANLLRISLHPDFMRNGLDREMILGKLWLDTKLNSNLKRVVISEKNDLYLGDIPYFYSRPNSKHIWDSKGFEIGEFFENSAIEEAIIKIRALNKIDCEEQVNFIKTAFLVVKGSPRKHKVLEKEYVQKVFNSDDYLQEAIKIGKYIGERAIVGEQDGQKDVSWVGSFVDNNREDQFKINPTNSTLYEGVGGISLFFAYLGYHTKQKMFTDIAKQALVPVLKSIPSTKEIGAFGGIGSYLYLLDHLSVLWKDEKLVLKELDFSLSRLDSLLEEDKNYDILTGVAGTAIVLSNLYKRFKDERIIKLIKKCGDHLVGNYINMSQGVGWKVEANPTPGSGFAHGASGISWSLYEIYQLTKEPIYKEIADKGIKFERTLFIPQKNNWADIRLEDGSYRNESFVAWCNGAAGIGLSRLLILQHEENNSIRNDAKVAINTIIEKGFEHDHSLCHGDLGNLEILMYGSEVLESKDLKDKVNNLSNHILNDIHKRGWLTGFEKNNESPSLMMGYAGIGLGLLKIFAPTQVPSVLRLQSPLELDL